MTSCLCSNARNTRVAIDDSITQPLASPPEIRDDEHLSRKMYERISSVVSPRDMGRHEAFVNVDAASSSHPAPAMRRMNSVRAPCASTDGYTASQGDSRASTDAGRGPHLLWTESRQILEVEIEATKALDHKSWQPDLATDEARLQQRLEKLKLDMQVVQGDGNCQFRSVSQALWGTQEYHLQVRQQAVSYMREHTEEFEAFLGEGVDSYLISMAKSGTWGDELTLRAICDTYGIVVNVLTSDQHNWFMRYKPHKMQLMKEVFLTYIAPVHYNAIRRRRPQQVLQRRLSSSLLRQSSQIQAAIDKARAEERTLARMSAAVAEEVYQNGHTTPPIPVP